MYPEITLSIFHIQSYGLMVVIGAAAAVLWCLYAVKRSALDQQVLIDLLIAGGIGALVGAKLLYVLTTLPWIIANGFALFASLEDILAYLSGGFVFYGGLIGLFAGVYIYARRHHLEIDGYLAAGVPAILLFHLFGRIGCFLSGCCYGEISDSAFAMPMYTLANPDVLLPRIPVQLYEAAVNLMLFAVLAMLYRHAAPGRRMLGIYLSAYGVMRFALEFLRGDALRGIAILSTSQWIALVMVPLGIFMACKSNAARTQKKERG